MESITKFNSSHGWQCPAVQRGNAYPWQRGACSSATSTSSWLAAGSCLCAVILGVGVQPPRRLLGGQHRIWQETQDAPGLHRWRVLVEINARCSQAGKNWWQLWLHRAALAAAATRCWSLGSRGRLEGAQRTLGFRGANRGLFRDCLAWSPGELPWRGRVPGRAGWFLKATYWELSNEPSCHVGRLGIS